MCLLLGHQRVLPNKFEWVQENILRESSIVSASVNSTRSRIVQSPDRIKKHISEMGRMAQDERVIIAGNEAKTRELKTKLDALNVYEQVWHLFTFYCFTF